MRKNLNIDIESATYSKCFSCKHLRSPQCNGPRTSSMELDEWCKYMRQLRDLFGLTNEYIAETADTSIKTINKIMAQKCDKDIYRDTARRIENAILGSCTNSPCYMESDENTQKLSDAMLELERTINDNQDYRKALDDIHAFYKHEILNVRNDGQRKIDFLLQEINDLRQEKEYLRLENDRKAKIIDKYLETA